MSGRSGGVLVYVAAAVAARSADAGAIVAAVLAGTAVAGPAAGGLLAAALTVPHLIGPLAGRLLDGRRRPGLVLAAAFVWYAVFVTVAALLVPVSVVGAAVALAAAGCAGPLVTGGLSSRLAGIVAGPGGGGSAERGGWGGHDAATATETRSPTGAERGGRGDRDGASAAQTRSGTQRRGQALDALAYGVSATVGPAAVAVLAAAFTPVGALGATAAFLLLAAAIVLWLPANATAVSARQARSVLRLLVTSAPLRRTTVATIGSATALAAAPFIATALAGQRGASPSTAAVLMSLYGAGGLLASLALIARPLTGDPERLVRGGVVVAGVALLAPLLALPFPTAGGLIGGVAFVLIGAASSALFAATLAARTEYSPPGAAARVFATVAGSRSAAARSASPRRESWRRWGRAS